MKYAVKIFFVHSLFSEFWNWAWWLKSVQVKTYLWYFKAIKKLDMYSSFHQLEINQPLPFSCPSCSHSCLRGTQVAQGPPSVCQISLLGASRGHSLSCQTVWTPPDLKVLKHMRDNYWSHIGLWMWMISLHLWNYYESKQHWHNNKLYFLCVTTGHPNMGGPMRMNPPRGMGGMGPQVGSKCTQCWNSHT